MKSPRTKNAPVADAVPAPDSTVQKPGNGDGRASVKEKRSGALDKYIRQHPVAATAAAVGAGLLLQAVVKSLAQRSGTGSEKSTPKAPQRRASPTPASNRRTHDLGAADMKFTTHHPDGKNVMFKFVWKKRPTDASEIDWSTDEMGFTSDRPNGKLTEFTFKSKTRPIPDEGSAVGDNRPGLGRAAMEFTSSAPGRRDFRFTWNRIPAAATAADKNQQTEVKPVRGPDSGALSAVSRQETRPAKKARQKKTSKKKVSKKKTSKKKTSKKKMSR